MTLNNNFNLAMESKKILLRHMDISKRPSLKENLSCSSVDKYAY